VDRRIISAEMLLRRLQMMKTLAIAVGVVTLASAVPAGAQTFTKDVAPILQKSCQS
jgi:hypothetical protein